jgi:hypothetical protein
VGDRSESVPAGTSSPAAGQTEQTPASLEVDMIDAPLDFKRWPFLRQVLGECRDSLVALYLKSDREARDEERVHRVWVAHAALFATLAVCLAILQLAHLRYGFMAVLEGGSIIAAVWAFRKADQSRKKWLTERHKAERCRLIKFASVIRPGLWTLGGPSSWDCAPELGDQIDDVKRMSFENVMRWLDDHKVSSPPGRILPRNLKQLTELRDYYREKRLKFQTAFFMSQSQADVRRDEWWRSVPHRLFTGSVIIVGVHVVIETTIYLMSRMNGSESAAGLLHWGEILPDVMIACAALLPVAGSGVRIWRSANEATRNMSRYRAKYLALNNIKQRMEGVEITETAEADAILRDLWCAEQIMESEHREWLRLMMGAEWIG